MINVAETQLPYSPQSHINSEETIAPDSSMQREQNIVLVSGESIDGGYVIHSLLNDKGKQSSVYLARNRGKPYAVKLYNNGWHPTSQMQGYLRNVRHPNLAHLVECGDYLGHYYEIYDYYPEGTLEDVNEFSSVFIQDVIVPSINEGLHELHSNGVIHCDIKPSNLFLADNEKRVVIGDFGISGYVNLNGKLVDTLRGTPEYSPRVKTLLGSASISPAFDYGSFGLVLCRAVLGYSLFDGMSEEEISKAWESGIDLPSRISGRLGVLIRGLLNEDEEQRWGYLQVKRWCEGEYSPSVNRNIYLKSKKEHPIQPLIFGRFDGKIISVSSLHQLSLAIKSHWAHATKLIKRRDLLVFIRQFDSDKTLTEKVRALSLLQDGDTAVFRLLTYIDDDLNEIVYCGKKYESLLDYINSLSTGKDEIAKKFLSKGLLIFYLRQGGYEQSLVNELEQLIQRQGTADMAAISTICFGLLGRRTIDIHGVSVESLDDLVTVISNCSTKEIDDLIQNNSFIAWLNSLGFEEETRRLRGS